MIMSSRRGWSLIATNAIIVVVAISACRTQVEDSGPAAGLAPTVAESALAEADEEPPTLEVTRIVVETEVVEVSPEPQSEETFIKEVVICIGEEPNSLYPYSRPRLEQATTHVLEGVYESMVTSLGYSYQARGIEKLPSLADGDAVIVPISVQEGDKVLDINDDVTTLTTGVRVKDSSGNIVEFDGSPISMSQMVVDFTLKPLVWSDGVPVSADDSVYSFELAADPQTPTTKELIKRTASYEATGDLSLEWKAIPGNLDTNYFTNIWTPYPRHFWGGYSAGELLVAEEANRQPISHGPFVLSDWVNGDHMNLVKNENYYLAEEGIPRVDAVRIQFVSSSSQLMAQLLSGECDIATSDSISVQDITFLLDAEKNGLLVPYFESGTVFEHIDFGIDTIEGFENTQPDWFEDMRVRQAFVMCTDRQRMVDELLFGRGEIVDAYIPPIHPLIPEDMTRWPHDVAAANTLLDQAGFADADEDGLREDQLSGTPFKVSLLSSTGNEMGERIASIFQENLAECKVEVEVNFLNSDQYFADGPEGPLFGRQFDLAAFPWLISEVPNCSLYLSSQIPDPSNGWNRNFNNETGFANPEFDAACNAALAALPGTPEYEQYHQEALRIWSEQMPIIPLFMRLKVAAARPGIENFVVDPTQRSELWNLYDIDIEPAE